MGGLLFDALLDMLLVKVAWWISFSYFFSPAPTPLSEEGTLCKPYTILFYILFPQLLPVSVLPGHSRLYEVVLFFPFSFTFVLSYYSILFICYLYLA